MGDLCRTQLITHYSLLVFVASHPCIYFYLFTLRIMPVIHTNYSSNLFHTAKEIIFAAQDIWQSNCCLPNNVGLNESPVTLRRCERINKKYCKHTIFSIVFFKTGNKVVPTNLTNLRSRLVASLLCRSLRLRCLSSTSLPCTTLQHTVPTAAIYPNPVITHQSKVSYLNLLLPISSSHKKTN